MQTLGFKTAHNVPVSGTEAWNKYDYIGDAPVPYQTWELVNSYPNATFILSTRDAKSWWQKRLEKHPQYPDQPTPCGHHDFSTAAGKAISPALTVAYEAWVMCLVPQDQIFSFDLWDISDVVFAKRLVKFLEQRGHQRRNQFWKVEPSPWELLQKCAFTRKWTHEGKTEGQAQEKTFKGNGKKNNPWSKRGQRQSHSVGDAFHSHGR
jgi:hypothetical protein